MDNDTSQEPLIIAHRGKLTPEDGANTKLTFEAAVVYKVLGIEFDVHLTADKKLVVTHPYYLEKGEERLLIETSTYERIKKLDPSIPLFDEVMEIVEDKQLRIQVDMKTLTDEGAAIIMNRVAELVKSGEDMIISANESAFVKKCREINSGIDVGLIFGKERFQEWMGEDFLLEYVGGIAKLANVFKVHIPLKTLEIGNFAERLKQMGLRTHTFVSNNEEYALAKKLKCVDVTTEAYKLLKEDVGSK